MQLRFASFAVVSLREDLHLQECAHAGRTKQRVRSNRAEPFLNTLEMGISMRILRFLMPACQGGQPVFFPN